MHLLSLKAQKTIYQVMFHLIGFEHRNMKRTVQAEVRALLSVLPMARLLTGTFVVGIHAVGCN